MIKHHTVITGTGRAGTTFLIQLLTKLGLDTGFTEDTPIAANAHAGLEWDIREADAPYIVKSPWLCDYLDDLVEQRKVIIDHAIIPMRDLHSAAESRRSVVRRTESDLPPSKIPGGLWHTDEPGEQDAILAAQLYKIIYTIAKRDIPLTLLNFPRFIDDPCYLYIKLDFLLKGVAYGRFAHTFHATVRPELVHQF